jgi:hypothetical protein
MAAIPTDYKFRGWLGKNVDSWKGQLEEGDFEPKAFEETDVDIQVSHCGICGKQKFFVPPYFRPEADISPPHQAVTSTLSAPDGELPTTPSVSATRSLEPPSASVPR